jgi:hypothetical protein
MVLSLTHVYTVMSGRPPIPHPTRRQDFRQTRPAPAPHRRPARGRDVAPSSRPATHGSARRIKAHSRATDAAQPGASAGRDAGARPPHEENWHDRRRDRRAQDAAVVVVGGGCPRSAVRRSRLHRAGATPRPGGDELAVRDTSRPWVGRAGPGPGIRGHRGHRLRRTGDCRRGRAGAGAGVDRRHDRRRDHGRRRGVEAGPESTELPRERCRQLVSQRSRRGGRGPGDRAGDRVTTGQAPPGRLARGRARRRSHWSGYRGAAVAPAERCGRLGPAGRAARRAGDPVGRPRGVRGALTSRRV